MKSMLWLLLSIPFVMFGSESEYEKYANVLKITKLLGDISNPSYCTNITLQKKNLDNDDLAILLQQTPNAESIDVSFNEITAIENVKQQHTSCKVLNLSDNKFTKSFPISLVLSRFPKLETLKLNNNKISCFDFKGDNSYFKKHDTFLKVVEARNTDFIAMDLKHFMRWSPLQELDLSESEKLGHVYSSDFGFVGRIPLKVILKGTKHDFSTQSDIKKYTVTALVVLISSATVGASVGWFLGGAGAATTTGVVCGLGAGFPLINCLPNEGKRAAVKFVTK
jgi:hypothetical protein